MLLRGTRESGCGAMVCAGGAQCMGETEQRSARCAAAEHNTCRRAGCAVCCDPAGHTELQTMRRHVMRASAPHVRRRRTISERKHSTRQLPRPCVGHARAVRRRGTDWQIAVASLISLRAPCHTCAPPGHRSAYRRRFFDFIKWAVSHVCPAGAQIGVSPSVL